MMKNISKSVLTVVIILLVTGSAAGQFGSVLDDFEDNNLDDDWTYDAEYSSSSTQAYEGQYALSFNSGSDTGVYTASRPISSNSPGVVSTWINLAEDHNGNDYNRIRLRNNGNDVASLIIDTGGTTVNAEDATSDISTGVSLNANTWYRLSIQMDYSTEQHTVVVYDESGNELGRATAAFITSASTVDQYELTTSSDRQAYYDFITLGDYEKTYSVSGVVKDSNGNGISGASVEAINESGNVVATDTTNDVGDYSIGLPNETYTIKASKSEYLSESKSVEVSGEDVSGVDFELTELEESIRLNTRNYLEHGQEHKYRVTIENSTGTYNVSTDASVISNDTSVVTVDNSKLRIIATNDTSINSRTYVEASYTDSKGNTYTAKENVTVANKSVENIGILPTGPRMGASLADETIQVILVATMLGAAVGFVSRSFAGLGTMTLVMTLGWLGGLVGNGMVIISVLIAMFIGLNIAANIDYTVAR